MQCLDALTEKYTERHHQRGGKVSPVPCGNSHTASPSLEGVRIGPSLPCPPPNQSRLSGANHCKVSPDQSIWSTQWSTVIRDHGPLMSVDGGFLHSYGGFSYLRHPLSSRKVLNQRERLPLPCEFQVNLPVHLCPPYL